MTKTLFVLAGIAFTCDIIPASKNIKPAVVTSLSKPDILAFCAPPPPPGPVGRVFVLCVPPPQPACGEIA